MHRILQGRDDFPKALAGYDETFIYNIYVARENMQKVAEDFKGIFTKISPLQFPKTVDELGELFAKHCGSQYLKSFDEVEKIIEKADEKTIIVIYSAGDIDYQLRKYLKILS
jgi:UDP-N-acetylmuramate-alanine ligase